MIERLLRRTAGEVRVRVTGASLPRFLNACTQGGVRLRRMERVSWDRMDATLSLGDFRKLRSCMGRTGCRVHILKRHGVPFVLARLLPRTALLAGLAAFCVMTYLVGTRVWEIRTDISPSLGEDAVMSKLASLGGQRQRFRRLPVGKGVSQRQKCIKRHFDCGGIPAAGREQWKRLRTVPLGKADPHGRGRSQGPRRRLRMVRGGAG